MRSARIAEGERRDELRRHRRHRGGGHDEAGVVEHLEPQSVADRMDARRVEDGQRHDDERDEGGERERAAAVERPPRRRAATTSVARSSAARSAAARRCVERDERCRRPGGGVGSCSGSGRRARCRRGLRRSGASRGRAVTVLPSSTGKGSSALLEGDVGHAVPAMRARNMRRTNSATPHVSPRM